MKFFANFLIEFFVILLLSLRVLYIFWILVPYKYMIYKYFLLFVRLSSHFLDDIVDKTKILNFKEVQILYIFFRHLSLIQGHADLLVCFLLRV